VSGLAPGSRSSPATSAAPGALVTAEPVTVIRPPGRVSLAGVRETVRFRTLIVRLAARDVTLRYRQTLLGVAWVIVQPLLGAGVVAVVFGNVAKLPAGGGVSYFLLAFAGTVWWTAASQALMRVTGSLVANAQLVSKVYFPRLVLPVSLVLSGLLDTAVGFGFFLVLLLATGPGISVALLLAPVWILLGLVMATGVGLAASTAAVRYRDVQQVMPLLVQLMFFASPVAYRLNAVPRSIHWVYALNPTTGLLEGFRWSTVGGHLPAALVAWSVVATVISAGAGLLIFSRWERMFADVI
jgi:lipopolysaccharide transport system permease protein